MVTRFAALPVIGADVRVAADAARRACCHPLTTALLVAFALALPSADAGAICDVIPGVVSEFRGALGSLNRPFAIPGDEGERITLTLDSSGCDIGSRGFVNLPGGTDPEDDYFVTVLFTPPQGGVRNAVILTTESSEATCLAAVADPPGGVSATCRVVTPDTQELQIANPSTLVFRFPDTDAEFAPDDDDHTFSGPATIAVSRVIEEDGETPASLPFDLASSRCADSSGLSACVDELYARDGTCETEPDHIDPIFGHFTALPPANDFEAICTPATNECDGLARDLRLTLDAAGNALIPMDWRGVLLRPHGIPVARLVRGDTSFEAFPGQTEPVRIPGRSFLASYSAGGRRLAPIFEPFVDPPSMEDQDLELFGSVDAPVGVIRIARRMPDLTGSTPVYRECTGGENDGLPCVLGEECPGGSCGATTCWIGAIETGPACTSDADCGDGGECGPALFDLTDRFAGGVGPVLVASTDYALDAENPVPIEGLIETPEMFAFVQLEQIAGSDEAGGGPQPQDLNGDGDTTDPVLVLRDRETGVVQPIGELGTQGRAATRVREPPFSYPAVAAEGDIVAFLEPEPLQFAEDANLDGDVFDSILRVYRLDPDCGAGTPCAEDLTAGLDLAVDAAPLIDGRSLVLSEGKLFFRTSETALARQETSLVSVASNGTQGNSDSSGTPALSRDGRFAAFESWADNLVEDDTNGEEDVFVHDRATGETTRVSVASDGTQGNQSVLRNLEFSAAGRLVAFDSYASNLVESDTNDNLDVFVHDLVTGETTRVSVASDGGEGNLGAHAPAFSGDGRFVAFESLSGNLVEGDTHLCFAYWDPQRLWNCSDIFVHDRVTGETTRVSVASDGTQANNHSFSPALSGDGRFVAFESGASNLVDGDSSERFGIFIHDRVTGETMIVISYSSDGSDSIFSCTQLKISADGRIVACRSRADNLVDGDTNGNFDVFVHDRVTRETTRVSVASNGTQGNESSGNVALSGDGRLVAFESEADNLVEGDTNNIYDVFVHDRTTGHTTRVSVSSDGAQAWGGNPALSADGRFVVFNSDAHNILGGEWNSITDVFVRGPDPDDLESDLTSDSDLDDTVLQMLDTRASSPQPVALGAAGQVSVSAGSAAFLVPELASGMDRNGDGDTDDQFVHLSVGAGEIQDLDREAVAIAMSSELIAALVPSGAAGETFVEIYDWTSAAPGWTAVGPEADLVDTAGSVVAFRAAATREFHVYDAATAILIPVGRMAEDFVLGESIVAFRTSEASQGGIDLNGDGDNEDDVLQVYDLVSSQLLNTGQAVLPCRLEACDPRVPYRISGDTVTFLILECDQGGTVTVGCPTGGSDLDGDGSAGGIVVQIFNVREAAEGLAVARGGAAPSGRLAFLAAEEITEAAVTPLAGTSAGTCTDTAEACASDINCADGTCFVPPGGCIENLGTECDTNPDDGIELPECPDGHFCVPILGSPGQGTCHVNRGPCGSTADCTAPAVCEDGPQDIVRLVSPLAPQSDGRQLFLSAGPEGDLIIANAPDTDGDGLADPFDNCPRRANADQADNDGDEVGDLCDLCDLTDPDSDLDGRPDCADNCPHAHNPGQEDPGGIGYGSVPDGIGEVCQCGDVSGDGFVTTADTLMIRRSLLDPPTATLVSPELCDVDGDGVCTMGDVETIRGVLLVPPTETIQQSCGPAVATRARTGVACGLGYELGALLPLLLLLARRRRARRGLVL